MDSESKSQIFSVAFNPEAEHFNELINIESHHDFVKFGNKFRTGKFELHIDEQRQPKWKIIGIRESYGSAWGHAMSYLKFHFKDNPEALELLDAIFDKKNPTKILIPSRAINPHLDIPV